MIKRALDISVSMFILLISLPILLVVAVVVLIDIGYPVLFAQERPGLNGRLFTMYKFRTMRDSCDESGQQVADKDRLSASGRLLRRLSLDELPGLFNVLRGDMSLVGPRPLLKEYLPLYSAQQMRRHNVRPGLTGWAQVNGRNALSWEQKFDLDIWYVDNQSIWLDLRILGMTIIKIIVREGIEEPGHATMSRFKGN